MKLNLNVVSVLAGCVALVISAPSTLGSAQKSPLERTWFAGGKYEVADIALPTITLAGGKLSGTDSCNNLTGSYKLKGKTGIEFSVASTRMLCPDMTTANIFQAALKATRSYKVQDGNLFLRNKNGATLFPMRALNK